MKSILIEGGMVVDPLKKRVEQRDLLIVNGKFENLEKKDSQAQIISRRETISCPDYLICVVTYPNLELALRRA